MSHQGFVASIDAARGLGLADPWLDACARVDSLSPTADLAVAAVVLAAIVGARLTGAMRRSR